MSDFNTAQRDLTANLPTELNLKCNVFVVELGPVGTITIRSSGSDFRAVPGRVYNLPGESNLISIRSTVSESVEITYGFGDMKNAVSNAAVMVPDPLPVSEWSDSAANSLHFGMLPPNGFNNVWPVAGKPRRIIISNLPASACPLYVGDVVPATHNGVAACGVVIMPGQSFVFESPDYVAGANRIMHLMNPDLALTVHYSTRWEM